MTNRNGIVIAAVLLAGAAWAALPAPGIAAETLSAPFVGGTWAVTTAQSFSGTVWLCVSGVGQASGTGWSDAFFVYTDGGGHVLPPPGVIGVDQPHPWHSGWILAINGLSADQLVASGVPTLAAGVPVYSPAHIYAFPIHAPGGRLSFGVWDGYLNDNTGSYTITVGTREEALGAYLDALAAAISAGGPVGDTPGALRSLFAMLKNAAASLRRGQLEAGARQVRALLFHLRAQGDRHLGGPRAAEAIAALEYLLNVIGPSVQANGQLGGGALSVPVGPSIQANGQLGGGALSVPGGTSLTFALDPVRPNPSSGGALTVRFSLPSAAPARLELLDVAGRRIASHDVGMGQHTLDLGEGQHLAPGLYLVRLTQGANTRTTRVAVIR